MKHLQRGATVMKDLESAHERALEAMRASQKPNPLGLVPPSEGHAPKGARGRATVKALGRTKTTGNFKRIEKAKGKGAAIGAFQNALAKHQGRPAPYHR